nr:MAG TPA: hypothetical protein [Caudoviricetes sp.]
MLLYLHLLRRILLYLLYYPLISLNKFILLHLGFLS